MRSKSDRMKKIHLENARKLRGMFFIALEDKETIKNAGNKLETPMAPALPCKTRKTQFRNMIERRHPLSAVTQVRSHGTTSDSLEARTQQASQIGR